MFAIYTVETTKNAERLQSNHAGCRLPFAGSDYSPAAPFDGGCVS